MSYKEVFQYQIRYLGKSKICDPAYTRKIIRTPDRNAFNFENQPNLSKKTFKNRKELRLSIRKRLLSRIDCNDLDQITQQLLYQARREDDFKKTADLLSLKSVFDQNLVSVGHVVVKILELMLRKDGRLLLLKMDFEQVDLSDNLKLCQLLIG